MSWQPPRLTEAQIADYRRDGYVVVPQLFSAAEVRPIVERYRADPLLGGNMAAVADSSGNAQNLVLWTKPDDDYIGLLPGLARFVEGAETLLGGPVYHWHSKLVCKPPGAPGRFDWHQDYGYWYYEGCLLPEMITVTVTLDGMDRANGAMEVIEGSHRFGRIDVKTVGQASGADPDRLALVMQRCERRVLELEPGDGIFFDGLTLHASGPNRSQRSRTLLHVSYNTVRNAPVGPGADDAHAYRPLAKVPDAALLADPARPVFHPGRFLTRKPGEDVHKASPVGFTVVEPVR
jgi:hypothetical protein